MGKTNMWKMGEHIALDRRVEVIGLDMIKQAHVCIGTLTLLN